MRRSCCGRGRFDALLLLLAMAFLFGLTLGCARAVGAPDASEISRAVALDYLGRGTAAFRAGDIKQATQDWSTAIRICRAIGAADLATQALVRRGEAYRVAGYYRDAEQDLHAALADAEQRHDMPLIAAASGALGNLTLLLRRTADAEPLLLRSRALASALGDDATFAASANDLGNLYAAEGEQAKAAAFYHEASTRAIAAGDAPLAANAEINEARLALQQHDSTRANALLRQAIDGLQQQPNSFAAGIALVSAVSVVLDTPGGTITPAQQRLAYGALTAAEAMAGASRNATLMSLALGNFGRLYERAGRSADASRLTEQALFAAQEAASPDLRFRWEWQQARLAREQQRFDEAIELYRAAVADLQSIRQDIPVEYRQGVSSYRTTFGPLYREFAGLLLNRAADRPTQREALLREARDAIERLRESELQDYFRDTCVTSFEAQQKPIETIAPGTAVLYPITLPKQLEILVSFGSELEEFSVPLRESELRQEVNRFRELLEKRTTNEYLVPARRLYDQLIRPLEPALAAHAVKTLVIVPDDVLRLVPFAALVDGNRFLSERYATAIAPSLNLVAPEPLARDNGAALILGISQSVEDYVPLPNVPQEVAAVHDIEGVDVLLNSAFTRNRFKQDLKSGRYDIVHIASHGEFGSDPSRTFVLAYDGKLTMDQLEADIKYGSRRDNPIDLLVLSACETASGDDRAALGLAGVALKAGARSALATLWYVNDKATKALITDFYEGLRHGLSRAEALRAAQRALAADPRFSHPAYWAPFLLIGNWL
jgi:CHAT domain-containing protein